MFVQTNKSIGIIKNHPETVGVDMDAVKKIFLYFFAMSIDFCLDRLSLGTLNLLKFCHSFSGKSSCQLLLSSNKSERSAAFLTVAQVTL